jgi:hypothetical protein
MRLCLAASHAAARATDMAGKEEMMLSYLYIAQSGVMVHAE